MSVLLFVFFAIIVALAAGFAVWPAVATAKGRGRFLLAGAIALFVVAIGAGSYLMLGRPALAVRALEGTQTRDMNGLIVLLNRRLRAAPGDPRGWEMLGRAYLTVGDADDAAKAFARAIAAAAATGHKSAALYSAYGDALAQASGNVVPPEAEAAFNQALALDPKDQAARYYLGFAYAARGEKAKAVAIWQSLLDDAPQTAPYRRELIDRIAALSAKEKN